MEIASDKKYFCLGARQHSCLPYLCAMPCRARIADGVALRGGLCSLCSLRGVSGVTARIGRHPALSRRARSQRLLVPCEGILEKSGEPK